MNIGIFSCKDCKERHPGCHSTCEKYLKEKSENDKLREADRKRREAENIPINSNRKWW